jgi:hypothetical protein
VSAHLGTEVTIYSVFGERPMWTGPQTGTKVFMSGIRVFLVDDHELGLERRTQAAVLATKLLAE